MKDKKGAFRKMVPKMRSKGQTYSNKEHSKPIYAKIEPEKPLDKIKKNW